MVSEGLDPRVGRLWDQLESEEQKTAAESKRLGAIWQRVAQMHRENEEARRRFEEEANFDFVPPSTRMVLNVGGHSFETTAQVLTRDRFSVLAALCKRRPPIEPDATGAFFLDRDWWVFRYILQFLRGGGLPSDVELLKEMHAEASFYRLSGLHRAIDAHMRRRMKPYHPTDEDVMDPEGILGPQLGGRSRGGVSSLATEPLEDPYRFTSGGARRGSGLVAGGASSRVRGF